MAVETPTNCFRGISKNYDPSRRCARSSTSPFFFFPHSVPLFDGTSSGDIRNLLGRGKVRVERENDLNNV